MKRHFWKIAGGSLLIGILITVGLFIAQGQGAASDKETAVSKIVFNYLEQLHYRQVDVNNEFSQAIFDKYIENLDYSKRFFVKDPDLLELNKYRNQLDDQLQLGSMEFMELANKFLKKRIEDAEKIAASYLAKPLDYTKEESLIIDREEMDYAKNVSEFKELWHKRLKAQVLDKYIELYESENKNQKLDYTKMDSKLEKLAREKVATSVKSVLIRMQRESREKQFSLYMNSMLLCYDPHTSYMPPQDEGDFKFQMTGKLEGIGALLSTDGEYIKIERLIPGGPAIRGKDLQVGERIIAVAQEDGEAVDVGYMPLEDATAMIRGPKGKTVRLTVKGNDGQTRVVSIVRDVVVMSETYARSALLKNPETGEKFGYISLPSFYRDFDNKSSRNATDDVRREIQTLKKQKVAGIILDLRNNPGGALFDAVNVAGLFIDEGPIVQVRDSGGRVQVYSDEESGYETDMPLVVMVNSFSASAAEIVSAALQDYGRAVIIGSKSTYGKGSVQTLYDCDQYLPIKDFRYRPIGSLKLTTQKYYRINGGSVQFKGVMSDVVLSDEFAFLELNEEHLDHALPWDTINPSDYKKWSRSKVDINELRQKSAARVQNNESFAKISEGIEAIYNSDERKTQPLEFKAAMQQRQTINERNKALELVKEKKISLQITPNVETGDEVKEWVDDLNKDIYLEEAAAILNDMIK